MPTRATWRTETNNPHFQRMHRAEAYCSQRPARRGIAERARTVRACLSSGLIERTRSSANVGTSALIAHAGQLLASCHWTGPPLLDLLQLRPAARFFRITALRAAGFGGLCCRPFRRSRRRRLARGSLPLVLNVLGDAAANAHDQAQHHQRTHGPLVGLGEGGRKLQACKGGCGGGVRCCVGVCASC